jgi:glycosyltransferase involved in cell wall biosynthesis
MKTAVIIPALNEVEHIAAVVTAAGQYVNEVIVVDDGSVKPLKQHLPLDKKIVCLRHRINLGKGAAMTTGAQYAAQHGIEAIVFMDADGQHEPKEIVNLLKPLVEDRADIVYGFRTFKQDMPLIAKLGNIFLTKMMSWLFRIKISDTQSGFRALTIAAYSKLKWRSPRYAAETEMIVNTGKYHVRWAEVPIKTIYLNKYRGMTVLDGMRIFINMISWRLQ